MPELPEVEHFRQLLLPLVCSSSRSSQSSSVATKDDGSGSDDSSRYLALTCPSPTPPKSFPTESDIASLNRNRYSVCDVKRKGKLLCVVLKSTQKKLKRRRDLFLFLHMGMTGRISNPDCIPSLESLKDDDAYPPPHTHLILKSNGHEAAFSDPRRFGAITLCDNMEEAFDDLAPDALDGDSTLEELVGQRRGIKALLLDQRKAVSGVGNWVADEVLYQSGIHPDQTHLTSEEKEKLHVSMRHVLSTAVECLAENKDFPEDWLFYHRWSKAANNGGGTVKDHRGRKVSFLQSGGRTSAVVTAVQKKRSRKSSTASSASKAKAFSSASVSLEGTKPKRERRTKQKSPQRSSKRLKLS